MLAAVRLEAETGGRRRSAHHVGLNAVTAKRTRIADLAGDNTAGII
jgi:hypothetical protein